MTRAQQHNVHMGGRGTQPMLFAHGFGCDQNMWRFVAPAFEDTYRTVVFDHIGAGGSDLSAYDPDRYRSLDGYADDVVELCRELGLSGGIFVGHSVSAMIGILASNRVPGLFDALVLVGPSPRYIDEDGYRGGFSAPQVEELLDFLDNNHMGWSRAMAPAIMGNPQRPELGEELTNSFCRTDPKIATQFARACFLSDNRADLKQVRVPCLVLQCSDDVIAPQCVGEYVHRMIPQSRFVLMKAIGHCPNLSAPEETIAAMKDFLDEATCSYEHARNRA